MAIVEAKRENRIAGLGRCVAEMVAIEPFNEREETHLPAAYGSMTSWNLWGFLELEGTAPSIDGPEYTLRDLVKILGSLVSIVGTESPAAVAG